MHFPKHFLSLTALAFAVTCARSDQAALDTAAASGASGQPAAQPATATLTTAAAETAKPSAAITQSGAPNTRPKSTPTAPHVTPAAADTARAQAPSAAKAPDTTRDTNPAAAPTAVSQPPATQTPSTPVATTAAGADSLGKPAYETNCRRCHGVRGVPPKTMQAKYPKIPTFDAAFVAKVSADSIVSVLSRGVNDDMKSFKDKLTRDEMRAVAVYLRALAR